MPAEGMVHALEIVHDILLKDSILIDIHPTSKPASVYYISAGKEIYLGELEENIYCIEYKQADQAIETALQRGLFARQHRSYFPFYTYADSLEELTDYLSEEWEDTTIPAKIQLEARNLMKESQGTGRLVIKERISITRFHKN